MGNRMVDYSGRGPTGACICKPDIVAPGSSIVSCSNCPGEYMVKSGTLISASYTHLDVYKRQEPGCFTASFSKESGGEIT